ncbi:50S ribosomal protein bL37 [Streptacidiphilus sp. MAP5-3]|jgi:hypothetical protein
MRHAAFHPDQNLRNPEMSKRARKKHDRRKKSASHGKRPGS